MRKIGSITPIWNQELWIKPHFDMLSKLDKNVALIHQRPLPNYHKEHGYKTFSDLSERILKTQFPKVELYQSEYPEGKEFGADIYNEGLEYVQDCDIVFRLDPDMFFDDAIWNALLAYIRETDFDCYRMDFAKDSINYYMTRDFDHGLKDAKEFDMLAFNPKHPLTSPNGSLEYPFGNEVAINLPDFLCHHFRGWNKPKSTPNPEWKNSDYARTALQLYGDDGDWYSCPDSIRKKIEPWLKELDETNSVSNVSSTK